MIEINSIKQVKLYDLECVQNVPVRTQYGVTNVVVFVDYEKRISYFWATSTSMGLGFKVNNHYNIKANLNSETNKLTHVEELPYESAKVKSEQPDAQDVLLGFADYNKLCYELDFKLKM